MNVRLPTLGSSLLFGAILFVVFCAASSWRVNVRAAGAAAADVQYDSIARILDTYTVGRYDEALAQLRAERNFRTLSKDFRTQAPLWIASASRAARDQRLHVVAVVALETALIGFSSERIDQFQRIDALNVIEFACDLLRRGPPTEFEHLWMLASVALIQGAKNFGPDQNDLWDRDAPALVRNPVFHDTDHYRHAFARFPSEARFPLAELSSRSEARRMPNRPGSTALSMVHGGALGPAGYEEEAAQHVQTSIKNLTAIINNPGTVPEVRLRRGILLFHKNDLLASLTDTRAAAAGAPANDPYVGFVAHLYAGMTLDSLDRRMEAIEEYRAALGIAPGARSAALTLASDLFVTGRHEQAAALLQSTFRDLAPSDPWHLFSAGDYRFWPEDLIRLREALQP